MTDIVAIASHILGNTFLDSSKAADCNTDGVINVTDIVAVANIILNSSAEGKSRILLPTKSNNDSGANFSIASFNIDQNQEKIINIDLNTPGESDIFTAFQFNLSLPKGVKIAEEDGHALVYLTNRTSLNNHTLECVKQTDDSYIILCYSTNLSTFYFQKFF